MDRRAAKELLHIQGWLERVEQIVHRGKDVYLADPLLQEAGDSLMMKVGEAANRLSRLGVLEPDGVEWALAVANRNFLIHQSTRSTASSPGSRSRATSRRGATRFRSCSRRPGSTGTPTPAEHRPTAHPTPKLCLLWLGDITGDNWRAAATSHRATPQRRRPWEHPPLRLVGRHARPTLPRVVRSWSCRK